MRNSIFSNDRFLRMWEIFLLVLMTVLLLVQISDPDIWFHLSIGREVFNIKGIPAQEFLVYPNADKPGAYHEWGFGLLHYLSFKVAGYWGMSMVNALMASLALFLVYLAARPEKNEVPYHFIALLAVFAWMEFRLVYRPEMVLYLFLATEIFLLERFLSDRHWKWLLPIPFAGFLLSQAHPSVIFMIAMLGLYLLQVFWESRGNFRTTLPVAAWFGLTAVGTVLLAAVNPYGFEQIILPFGFAGAGRVTAAIEEFFTVLQSGYQWSYFTLVIAAGLALVMARKKRPLDWLLFLVFGVLAFRYVRNIGLFALVMYVPLARGFSDGMDRLVTRMSKAYPGLKSAWLLSAGWAMSLAALLAILFSPIVIRPWGAGPVPLMFPETVVNVIREIRPPGRLFNFYDIGGYLGWALDGEYPVFIDGRHYSANRALSVHHAVIAARSGWQRALDNYDVNIIVIQGTFKTSGELIPVVIDLAQNPDWVLAARGERAMLFLRREIASGLPSRYHLDKREVWQQVILEADYVLHYIPFSPKAHLSRAEALLALGHDDLAVNDLETYLEMTPGDDEIAARLRELKAANP